MLKKIQDLAGELSRTLAGHGVGGVAKIIAALVALLGAILGIAGLFGGIAYYASKQVLEVLVNLFNQASDQTVLAWLPESFASVVGWAVFFCMTVGIVLMIDELRKGVVKFVTIGLICTVGGIVYSALLPVCTLAGPLAIACLQGVLLLFLAAAVMVLLGEGDAAKFIGGCLPIGLFFVLIVVLLFSFFFGGKKDDNSNEHAEREVKTVQLTLGAPQGVFNNISWETSHRFVSSPSMVNAMGWELDKASDCGVVIINDRVRINQCGDSPVIPSLRAAGIIGPNENVRSLQFEGIGMKGYAYVK